MADTMIAPWVTHKNTRVTESVAVQAAKGVCQIKFPEGVTEADRDVLCGALLSNTTYEIVEDLVACGSRFTATQSEREAASLLKKRMSEYGLTSIRDQEFEFSGWARGETSLTRISRGGNETLEAISLPHCPQAQVEGELAFVGYGTPADFAERRGDLVNKIVIVDAKKPLFARSKPMHRKDRYLRAVDAGAAGFVWMRDKGGFLPETGSLFPGCTVPGVGVSRETGMQLIRMLEDETVWVRIDTDNHVGTMESANVVGELLADCGSDRMIVVGAHYDGHDIAQGAIDNATGVAIALEAARLLAPHSGLLKRNIRFVLFSGEELGKLGSLAYVEQIDDELDSIDFMFNLDGAPGRGGTMGLALQDWPELLPLFRRAFSEMKMSVVTDIALKTGSDIYPFTLKGVPGGYLQAVDLQRTGRNWAHTAADTIDKVSKDDLIKDSMMFARLLLHIAAWPGDWPGRRYTPEEVRALTGE